MSSSAKQVSCVECGKEFNYHDPNGHGRFYLIQLRVETTRGSKGEIAFCEKHAPLGNTSIPSLLDPDDDE